MKVQPALFFVLIVIILAFVLGTGSAIIDLNKRFFAGLFPIAVTSSPAAAVKPVLPLISPGDADLQKPLGKELKTAKVVYLTSWAAGKESMVDYILELARITEINAVVIDIKDFSGHVAYKTNIAEVERYDAKREIRLPAINAVIKKFHENGLYVIGRLTIFQDPVLAKARPDLAIHSLFDSVSGDLSANTVWLDRKGLSWIDPAAQEAWQYNISIAKDAVERGFDEINFDYIRFPADGDLYDMRFLFWDGQKPMSSVLRDFYAHLRDGLPGAKISADLFGLTTVNHDDLGVGQVLEDAADYFDFISPMLYPSHYSTGFMGFDNPNEHPYEVVKRCVDVALRRLSGKKAELRPWLQDFSLRGVAYDAKMVGDELKAVRDASKNIGFMLWSPTNIYTSEALERRGQ
jgi:hypothetical protein